MSGCYCLEMIHIWEHDKLSANVYLEGTLGDVSWTVGDVDDVVAGLLGRVGALVDELADLLDLHRFVLAARPDDLRQQGSSQGQGQGQHSTLYIR